MSTRETAFHSFSKADAPMPFTNCPNCEHQLQYVPEMCGVAGICPACSAEVVYQQTPWQIVRPIAVAIVAVLSLAGLAYLCPRDVIVVLLGFVGAVLCLPMLAFILFPKRLRFALWLTAFLLGAGIVGAVMAAANMDGRFYASKKRADVAITSPFFASNSNGLPVGRSPL